MRVLLVTRGFPPTGRWGSEAYSCDLARGLARRGHDVHLLFPVPSEEQRLLERQDEGGVSVYEFRLPTRPGKPFRDSYDDRRQSRAIRKLCEARGPFDRVHFTSLGGGVSVGQIAACRPHVGQIWLTVTDLLPLCHRGQLLDWRLSECTDGPEPRLCTRCALSPLPFEADGWARRYKTVLARFLGPFGAPVPSPSAFARRTRVFGDALGHVDRVLAPSQALADRYQSSGLVAPEKVEMLPYALDPERFRGYTWWSAEGALRLAYLGQIAPHKGVHTIVEAVERLHPEHRKRLSVALHGAVPEERFAPYEDRLLTQIMESALPIEMPGPFPPDRAAPVLAQTDVVLMPSLWVENLPLVLLQARACRIPVLASRVAGIAEFVADGRDGLLVDPRDPEAWAEALRRLVSEAGLMQQLREGAAAATLPISYDAHLDRMESVD